MAWRDCVAAVNLCRFVGLAALVGAEGPALLEALKKQVEFYFSKENLANDTYLVSQMNSQHYVPISTILEVRCLHGRVVLCMGGWWLSVVALHGCNGVWRDAA